MYWIDGEWLLIQVVEKLINGLEEFNKRKRECLIVGLSHLMRLCRYLMQVEKLPYADVS